MLKQKKIVKIISFFIIVFQLMGCGSTAILEDNTPSEPNSLKETPELDYELPTVSPGVLVNQIGYEPDSIKKTIIRGKQLPAQFQIVDMDTNEVVYTGVLEEQGYDEATGEYSSYGDFSEFTQEGQYFIECEIVGQSYSFEIKENLYTEIIQNSLQLLEESRESFTKEDIIEVSRSISVLLLSYELYAPVYDSNLKDKEEPIIMVEIKDCVNWLLAWQDSQTGAVMDGETPLILETAWLSAVLAKFSYTYQKYDSIYATVCLQAADRAWLYVDKNTEETMDEVFYAATELYRATGQYKYHREIKNLGQNLTIDVNEEAFVFGTLTYAATRRRVDVDLCARLTDILFLQAESIAELSREKVYMVGSGMEEVSLSAVLWDMVVMSSVDYIITNHEYATIIENHQNYLAGQNENALCYISEKGSDDPADTPIGESCVNTARYIMMLSEILSHR